MLIIYIKPKEKQMNNNNYIGRTHHKFESVLNFYAAKIFKPVLDIENVLALETKEPVSYTHLTLPTTERV